MSKKFTTLIFLCELSHQQRNNIIGLAAIYKIFGVNAHKEIIKFYIFCSSEYKIHVAFGGNAAYLLSTPIYFYACGCDYYQGP